MAVKSKQRSSVREFHKALVELQACPNCLHEIGYGPNPFVCPRCDYDVTEYYQEIIEDRHDQQDKETRS